MDTLKLVEENKPFRTNWNNLEIPQKFEKTLEPSKTIPDQALTVKEILKRYASGIPLNQQTQRVPMYHGEEFVPDIDDFKKMDLSERHDMIRENLENIDRIKQNLQKHKIKQHGTPDQPTTQTQPQQTETPENNA